MNAAAFNARFSIGDKVIHDPAPLLGEAAEMCEILEAAFDRDDGDPDFPIVLWSGVMLRRQTGETILAQLDHLQL